MAKKKCCLKWQKKGRACKNCPVYYKMSAWRKPEEPQFHPIQYPVVPPILLGGMPANDACCE